MNEQINTGGLMRFDLKKSIDLKLNREEKDEIAEAYEQYYERRRKEKLKKKIIFWIIFLLILLIIAIKFFN
jgi:hypothetical protein